jgi:excisionase family DNA binding protein
MTYTKRVARDEDEYVAAAEAARCLHVSPKTINRWANEGLLPCIVTLGGHRRFRREDISAAAERMAIRGQEISGADPSVPPVKLPATADQPTETATEGLSFGS